MKNTTWAASAAGHGVAWGTSTAMAASTYSRPAWPEAPADPAHGSWPGDLTGSWGATGIRKSCRVTSMGINWSTSFMAWVMTTGLFLMRQTKRHRGRAAWSATIDNSVASVHALLWADIDNDGKANEIVTGKRVYAHEIEPGRLTAVAWYAFDPSSKNWAGLHVIFQGEPAKNAAAKGGDRLALKDFPPGTAGTGLQMTAIDIDRDGDLDLLCPGKSGLYLFENLQGLGERLGRLGNWSNFSSPDASLTRPARFPSRATGRPCDRLAADRLRSGRASPSR